MHSVRLVPDAAGWLSPATPSVGNLLLEPITGSPGVLVCRCLSYRLPTTKKFYVHTKTHFHILFYLTHWSLSTASTRLIFISVYRLVSCSVRACCIPFRSVRPTLFIPSVKTMKSGSRSQPKPARTIHAFTELKQTRPYLRHTTATNAFHTVCANSIILFKKGILWYKTNRGCSSCNSLYVTCCSLSYWNFRPRGGYVDRPIALLCTIYLRVGIE